MIMRQIFFLIALIVGFFYYKYKNEKESVRNSTPFMEYLQTSVKKWINWAKNFKSKLKL
jgi:hypothetical protein